MKHINRKWLAAILSVVMVLSLLPVAARAEGSTEFNVAEGPVTINTDGTYTITGSSENGNTITVESGTVTITLNNVTVKNSTSCAFNIQSGNVTLILADETENTFESGNYYAGIHVADTASLTIKGNGTLTAVSKAVPDAGPTHNGTIGAGIGGNGEIGGPDETGNGQDTGDNAGDITIESGTIYAKSEGDGAGIGGGWTSSSTRQHGRFKSITINGGTVYAKSERNGAGIGGGCWASQMGTITITGGEIHAKTAAAATSGDLSYDIGAGHGVQTGGEIKITGGVVYTEGEKGRGVKTYNGPLTQSNTIIFSSNGNGEVYGDVTLDSDLTIESGHTLHIPEGSRLTVSEGRTLTVKDNATLKNDGVLDNKGTVTGEGSLTGRGEVIGSGITTMGYYVRVTVPAFESVREEYTQPEAHVITIQNKGTKQVTISSVEVYGNDFTVEPADPAPGGVQLPSGGKYESYKIGPNANLSSGIHTAIVTVTYDGGRETAAKVSFMVHPFAVGEGTLESPYQIRDLDELEKFRNYVNEGNDCSGMYFQLMQDIDMSTKYGGEGALSWDPIGMTFNGFCGTFDGGGHTIRGLYINSNSNSNSVQGLFRENAGTISSLNVSGTIICGERSNAGMIVGMNGGTVTGCNSSGSVTVEDKTGSNAVVMVGGIVGQNVGAVTACTSTAEVTVTAGGDNAQAVMCGAGGIVGVTIGGMAPDDSDIQPTVKNCAFSGKVTGSVSGGTDTRTIMVGIGGVVGMSMTESMTEGSSAIMVEGCSNSGIVSGSGSGGTMTGVGGIMGFNMVNGGTTCVKNCLNTGTVLDSINGTVSGAGGIVGTNLALGTKNATVENCCNTGTVTVTGDTVSGAVVGVNSAEISYSYYDEYTIPLSGTVTNCYYLDTCGAVGEGTPKTTDEFASGEVAYLLQGEQDEQVWGQTMGSGTPELTDETSKKVYKITGKVDGQNDVVWYTNSNATLPDAAPSKSGFTFAGWSTKANGPVDFESGTPVTADTTVYAVWKPDLEGSGTQDAPYLIPDKAALEAFRDYVNAGNDCAELYFKVTEDIDLKDESWTPIGSNTIPFKGAFDGGNHTVSGLLVSIFGDYHGLFGKIENGTVKNLGVAGSVSGDYYIGGIAGCLSGGTIENCHSNVRVNGSRDCIGGIVGKSEYGKIMSCYNLGSVYGNAADIGGIVGANITGNEIINCYNLGSVSASNGSSYIGGIMGSGNGTVTNCYNMGTVSGGYISSYGPVLGAIKGTSNSGTVINSYYLDTSCEEAGDGTAKTAEEFASGEVAHLLQDGQETPVWGQTLPSDTHPVLTSDPAAAVHTVTFRLDGSEDDVKYVNTAGLTELPDAPEKAGFTFAGWSTAEDGPVDFESGTPVTADVTLYPIYETTPSADAALRGKVTEGGLPVAGASVTLRQGGKDVHTAETGAGGSYSFEDVEPGIYEVVVEADGKTMTTMVTVTDEAGTEKDLTMPDENVSSKLEVKGEDTPAVVVGGLDKEAQARAEANKAVTVTMTVEAVTDGAADNTQDLQESIDAIKIESTSSEHEYLNLTLEKTVSETGVGDETTEITETTSLITVVIPFDPSGKSNIVVYRYHNSDVDTLTESKNGSGEYIEITDEAVTVHAKNFSTYAIGYTVQTAPTSYAITVPQVEHGTVTADRRSAIRGRAVTLTATPDEGCHLASLTVTDRRGKPVELTDNGDGTYTFTQPSGRVTIAAQFVPCPTLGYADLDAGAWYHDCTDYVITNALMRGVADGIFDPDGAVTRAQMVTVLWNMRGDPVVNYYMTYADVAEADWYAEAVRWAASEGIAGGYGGLFRPNDPVTREELAVMLYRYEQKFGSGGFTGQWSYRLPFTDLDQISDWAFEAVAWCNMKGVVLGRDNTVFDPSGPATRAELAAILTRYCGEDDIK